MSEPMPIEIQRSAAPRRAWRLLSLLLRLGIAVALFAWLATRIEWTALRATLASIEPLWVAAGLLVLWGGLAVAVVRWRVILRALRAPHSLTEITRIFGAGLFLSLFLPTGVGGDVYRLARISAGGFGIARAGVSLLFERGLGLIALLLLLSPVVALHERTRDLAPLSIVLGAGALAVLTVMVLWGRTLSRWIAGRLPALAPALGDTSWTALMKVAPQVIALSLVNHLTTIGANWLFARALGLPLTFGDALALVPLIVLAGQLPISPGGLGVRETAFVYFYGRVGIASEGAFGAGLIWLFALYLTGGLGALLFLVDRRRTSTPSETAGADRDAYPESGSLGGLDSASHRT